MWYFGLLSRTIPAISRRPSGPTLKRLCPASQISPTLCPAHRASISTLGDVSELFDEEGDFFGDLFSRPRFRAGGRGASLPSTTDSVSSRSLFCPRAGAATGASAGGLELEEPRVLGVKVTGPLTLLVFKRPMGIDPLTLPPDPRGRPLVVEGPA